MVTLLLAVVFQATLTLQSPAFKPNGPLPLVYTGYGDFTSPPLSWRGAPKGTREFVLTLENNDAPLERFSVHWLLYGIPSTVTSLPAGPKGTPKDHPSPIPAARRGLNAMKWMGYLPPRPIEPGQQRYTFTLYAIDTTLSLAEGASEEQLLSAIKGHILAEAKLQTTFEHKP